MDIEIEDPLMGAQGYQGFSGIGPDIALYAGPAHSPDIYQSSFCLPGSFNFISLQTSPIIESKVCYEKLNRISLVAAIHFVSL